MDTDLYGSTLPESMAATNLKIANKSILKPILFNNVDLVARVLLFLPLI
jgi:hypothetical protein